MSRSDAAADPLELIGAGAQEAHLVGTGDDQRTHPDRHEDS